MTALPLLDYAISAPERAEVSRTLAAHFIESSLADLEWIKRVDGTLMPDTKAALERPTAVMVRGLYEDWARQAEGLLDRVERLQAHTKPIPGYEALRDAHGRTRAMLSVSLEDMEQGRRDLLEGRMVSAEEVRRELRVGVH
ncbi:MAG TPA: hypothetical protein VG269_03120 [Tepidisphaeraceae bacterium]|jgi:hypothetical protein|nr:hypothetical protein [Tepidisphaeraceae bacterium]